MAEELKHLIDQIQKEGVEKAQEQAENILLQAREKAARIVNDAEKKAVESLRQAKIEAEAFTQRSTKTLEQAARDLLITVGQGCGKVIFEILDRKVTETIQGDLLEKMILQVIKQSDGSAIGLGLAEKDKVTLTAFCAAQAKKSDQVIELVSDNEVLSGFKVNFKDQHAYLDVTGPAIADALAAFLRPELAKIISAIAQEELKKA